MNMFGQRQPAESSHVVAAGATTSEGRLDQYGITIRCDSAQRFFSLKTLAAKPYLYFKSSSGWSR